jgi:hypothetical protein
MVKTLLEKTNKKVKVVFKSREKIKIMATTVFRWCLTIRARLMARIVRQDMKY